MKRNPASDTRRTILSAAEKRFAAAGFGGTSINDVASDTRYSKPVIYYHFGNKEGLFMAVLEQAHDRCHQIMRQAAEKSGLLQEQLVDVLAALFAFLRDRKDLTRLAFAAAFAAPKELPRELSSPCQRRRNFDFFHGLVRKGMEDGTLDRSFDSRTLTYGIYGALSFYLMANLLLPGTKLDRRAARNVVRLFLQGAAAK